jgi:hypothetical protein
MPSLVPWGIRQFFDGNGSPLVAGSVGYYQVGTGATVVIGIWGDQEQTIPLENPIPLDAGGFPYSGGSQQSIWGLGRAEEVVRDRNGVVVTTAVIDFPLPDTGNVTINGNLTVTGTSDLQGVVTTGSDIDVAGNANITGNVTAYNGQFNNNVNANGNISAGGTVSGNIGDFNDLNAGTIAAGAGGISDGGNLTVSGSTSMDGPLNMNGQNINNVGTLTANTISATTYDNLPPAPGTMGHWEAGANATNNAGQLTITFQKPFINPPVMIIDSAEGYTAAEVQYLTTTYVTLLSSSEASGIQPGVPFTWAAFECTAPPYPTANPLP